jgi:hypothetical protein
VATGRNVDAAAVVGDQRTVHRTGVDGVADPAGSTAALNIAEMKPGGYSGEGDESVVGAISLLRAVECTAGGADATLCSKGDGGRTDDGEDWSVGEDGGILAATELRRLAPGVRHLRGLRP